jgi:predicted permease
MNDLRFAFRQLLKNPGFTAVAVLTLALGIGANTVVFSWMYSVLLHAVPGVRDAGHLVVVCTRHASGRLTDTTSLLDNQDLGIQSGVFAGIAGSCYDAATLRVGDQTDWVWTESTTANFFDVLGVQPAVGRFFRPDEDTHPGGDNVAVLSHGLWQRRFGGDPAMVGSVVEIANRPFTVVGIAPREFNGGMGGLRFDLWIPVSMAPNFAFADRVLAKRNVRFLHTYARLKPGVTIAQAQAAANGVMQRLERQYADTNREIGAAVLPVWKSPWGGQSVFLPLLRSLSVIALLLLLLVIANVGNLQFVRASARQQEVAVRLALGAGRGRLTRQLLTESILLAGIGGVLGCLFAAWSVNVIFSLLPPTHLPIGYRFALNGTVLAFTAALTLVTGILFGLAPALQSVKAGLSDSIKQGGRSGALTAHHQRLRGSLVVAEVALALVLLVGMTLCVRSLQNARQVDVGLDSRNVWLAGFRLPPVGYTDDRAGETYRRLQHKLASLPGVESVALADWLPLGLEGGSSTGFAVDGYQPAPGESVAAGVSTVSSGYFRSLRIPILAGREFDERDHDTARRAAIINQYLAVRYFNGRDPVGLKIRFWNQELTIVGVARNGKYRALNEPQQAFIYVAAAQFGHLSFAAALRTTGDPRAIGAAVERAAIAIDPLLKPAAALTMADYTAAAFTIPRMAATLVSVLGGVALLLAALGIYGVMAYSVSERTREIGVRIALGAQRFDVLNLFLKQGLKLAGIGLVLGIVGALLAAPMLSSLLVGVGSNDPISYVAMCVLLCSATLLACWLPARRATRVDPIEALRHE